MTFLFSKPLPDELAKSHLYRICAMNNIRVSRLLAKETKNQCPKHCNHPWTWIYTHHIMSYLSDMTPQAYRAHHTQMPLMNKWYKVYSLDAVKESTTCVYDYPQFHHHSIASTYDSKICSDCRTEDLRAFSMTYWHREHQIPGLDICPKHQTPLAKFEDDYTYYAPNPVDIEGRISDKALVMANFHPVIMRYQDIALLTLRNPKLVRFEQAHDELLSRAMDLGVCRSQTRHTGQSYIENHIGQVLYENLPRAWMAEHFSTDFLNTAFYPHEMASEEYHTKLDRLKYVGGAEPIFILLALAALFESTNDICSILFEPAADIALPQR
ncbi:hypothetical protein D7I39_03065 [Allopusillimonas ginsengisoli]|nr:hypothetical protein D7I39_03065 [Allopusillimonas ginsengisoli]